MPGRILVTIALFCFRLSQANAYSVLTHEAMIDVNWQKVLVPLLELRYPGHTPQELNEARAYAYGGAVAPDLGYYPFGSRLFTDLIHYVRSGDFVMTLLDDAGNMNEYAFALGVLCHYNADKYGHSLGINQCVPIMYPRMKKRFGDTVTYADNHISHIRTEFSFDVLQTARGNYSSTAYHKFIGFKIAESLLESAFLKTYGINVNRLFKNFSRTVSRFRWIIINLFPEITKAAWQIKRQDIRQSRPGSTSRNFIFRMRRKNYKEDFNEEYKKPGLLAHVIAIFFRMAPKIGPLRILKFESPGPEAEIRFIQSFDATAFNYSKAIGQLRAGHLRLNNIDFDTGNDTAPGEYSGADYCYYYLLIELRNRHFEGVTAPLKEDILSFYSQFKPDSASGKSRKQGQTVLSVLEELKAASISK